MFAIVPGPPHTFPAMGWPHDGGCRCRIVMLCDSSIRTELVEDEIRESGKGGRATAIVYVQCHARQ